MNKALVILGLSSFFLLPGRPSAEPIPAPLKGVTVSVTVSGDSGRFLVFHYRVFNPNVNDGQIRGFEIEISRSPSEAILSRNNLENGPSYFPFSSEDALQRVPMVPVGIVGPAGWIYGFGYDDRTPPRGFASWGSKDEPFRIFPGQTREGFELTSPGLPGIREAILAPSIDWDNVPDEFEDPTKARALRDSLDFTATTVGPKAPPKTFAALESLNYLISLLHQSRQLGWVTRDGAQQSLLAKLVDAKRKLEEGNGKVAKNILNAFLNEVRAGSCQQFTCPGNKPLTSEAYALLFFNGQYLFEQLP